VIFVARAADESLLGIMGPAFTIAMGSLGIVAPLSSAANWVAADLFAWSHRLTREWEVLAAMNAQLDSLRINKPPEPPSDAPAAVVPMVIIMWLMGAGPVQAQTQGYLFSDKTTSVDAAATKATISALTDKVSEFGQGGILRWSVVPFADDAFKTIGRTFTFEPVKALSCTQT